MFDASLREVRLDGLQTKKREDGLDELLVVCGKGADFPQRGEVGVLNERAEFGGFVRNASSWAAADMMRTRERLRRLAQSACGNALLRISSSTVSSA